MGIGMTELLIILGIVIVIFGTKKLRNVGSDLGGAVKGFKDAMNEGNAKVEDQSDRTVEGEVTNKSKSQ